MARVAIVRRLLSCLPGRTAACFAARHQSTICPVTTLTQEEEMMRETVIRFANEKIKPLVREMDESSQMDKSVIKGLFDNGLMGIEVDSNYGGAGSTFFSSIIAIEELACVDPSVSVMCDVQNTLINAYLREYASKEMQEKYFPQLTKDTVGCFCLSETSSGSDAFALQTRADRDGEHWILNGEKMWITNAEHSGLFVVHANVDFSKKHRGITAFMIEKETAGLEVGVKEDKLGIRASSTCPVYLNDVRVHESQVLGEVGKGYKYAIGALNIGRIGIGAQMLGLARGALDNTLPYLYQRKQFGNRIADFQAMQHMRAQLATEIEAARLLIYNAARLKDAGKPFIKEAAMAKYFASETAVKVASRCVEMMGGVGFIKSTGVEKFYRDAKIGQIYEGTSFVQLTTIAKEIDKELGQ